MRQTALQLMRFGIVGIVATLSYFTSGQLLSHFSSFSGMQVHLAAFALSIVISYLGHAHYTFSVSGKQALTRFVCSTVLLLIASTGLTRLPVDYAGFSSAWNVVAVSLFYPVASFLLHRFWTFLPAQSDE